MTWRQASTSKGFIALGTNCNLNLQLFLNKRYIISQKEQTKLSQRNKHTNKQERNISESTSSGQNIALHLCSHAL